MMGNRMSEGFVMMKKSWVALLVCAISVGGTWNVTEAALLDGMFDDVEESLAESLAEKGEKLTIGNFYTPDKPNSHGPIGMMGDHTHGKGEIMFSYRFMRMDMDGNRDGTNRVDFTDILPPPAPPASFAVTPTDMIMDMHMVGAMYGVNDTLTVSAMIPFIKQSMNHETGMGVKFKTESEGIGDIKIGSLWRLYALEAPSLGAHRFHMNLGLSMPTGSIKEKDVTPAGFGRLPFPMQIGSGTVDVFPGLTYGGEMGDASWGAQAVGTIRIGRNEEGYSKGDAYELNLFGAYAWTNWISTSLRLNWMDWSNYNGEDRNIAARTFIPTADPNRRGGERLDVLPGVNLLLPELVGIENRIGAEVGIPLYQRLDGPQLETDWVVNVGWQVVY